MQTNLEILNEQLAAKGYPAMIALNAHEVRNLPDGNIVLLGVRDVVSTTAQGGTPAKPVTLRATWYWSWTTICSSCGRGTPSPMRTLIAPDRHRLAYFIQPAR